MKIKAVIFDWAGTLIDQGSCAPAAAFQRCFADFGVAISLAEARGPMGLPKRAHIASLLADPHIARRWQDKYNRPASPHDIEALYQAFLPLNETIAADYADLIDGARETLSWLAAHDIKVGTTTGYTRSIMERVLPRVAEQGFEPASLICSDDLSEGRPGPLAMYQSFVNLGVYPPGAVVKVDDTTPGLAEGKAAGSICVGVTLSGNAAALDRQALAALGEDAREDLHQQLAPDLLAAGADYALQSIAELPELLEALQEEPLTSL